MKEEDEEDEEEKEYTVKFLVKRFVEEIEEIAECNKEKAIDEIEGVLKQLLKEK